MMNDVVSYVQEDVGFYPTPPELVEKMLSGVKWHLIETVLEPSAGKGNIVYGILEGIFNHRHTHYDRREFMGIKVDCIEIDPNLRGILEYTFMGKKAHDEYEDELRKYRDMRYDDKTPEIRAAENEIYKLHSIYDSDSVRIVGGDFLNFITHKRYDLIVMNPPFEFGAEHLLRAIQIQEENGGDIICLLNAETIRNPYSKIRKVLQKKLQKHEAEISFLEKQFSHAERETDVEIAMVKIEIPRKQRDSLFFEALKKAEEVKTEKAENDEIISANPIQQMIDLYNFECKATIRLIREYEAMMPYIQDRLPFGEDEQAQAESMKYSKAIITLTMAYGERSYSQGVNINEYLKAVRMKYWYSFFRNDQFTGQLTSNLRKEFEEKVDEMAEYDFSMFNIQQVLKRIEASLSRGVEETILATFDKLSSQHSWYPECQNNIHYYSGWKTNQAHRINKKVIIPIHGCFAYDSWYRKCDDTISVSTIYSTLSDTEWRIADWVISHFPQHKVYLEPFFGSGAVFFKKDPVYIETVNDINGEIVNLFRVCREYPEELARAINLTPFARDEFRNCYLPTSDPVEQARRTLVRYHQSFGTSNSYKNSWRNVQTYGGPRCATMWNDLPDIIVSCCQRLKNAQIENTNAITLIKRYDDRNTFIYCDPPYLQELRKRNIYANEMSTQDHIELLETIKRSRSMVAISGYDNDLYNSVLQGWNTDTIETTAQMGLHRTEKIWTNF